MRMHRRLFRIVAIFILFSSLPFAPASAQGNPVLKPALLDVDWYVSAAGNDSNSCSSVGSPCATINGAIGKASSGDTIKIAIGTFTGIDTEVVLINKNITLSGGWNASFTAQHGQSTIDGQGARGAVRVNSEVTATIERMVMQNGNGGSAAGIFNLGVLTINSSAISNNNGTGIYNYFMGTAVMINSTIDNNIGGGILNAGDAVMNNVTISGNRGTGLYNTGGGTAIFNNSTISDNTGLYSGGMVSHSGTITLKNTIVAGNSSTFQDQGPDCIGPVLTAGYNLIGNSKDCEFTPTTGDLTDIDPRLGALIGSPGYHSLQTGSPAINAGNPAAPGSDNNACLTYDARGVTRPIDGRCDIGAYEYSAPGSLTNLSIFSGDRQYAGPGLPFLHPLKVIALDNQGNPVPGISVTFTAPASGASGTFTDTSTRITTVLTDANGIATTSTFTANTISGAYTVVVSATGVASLDFHFHNGFWHVATTGSDSNDCLSPVSPCATINGAISKANDGDTIHVASGTYTGTGTEAVLLEKSIAILGGWDATFTAQNGISVIDGQGARRGVLITTATTVTLDRLVIQNGFHAIGGAGLSNHGGNVTLSNSLVRDNISEWTSAGIHNSGTMTISNTEISHNTAGTPFHHGGGGGAGIENGSGTLTLNNSTVNDNVIMGGYSGSGIYNLGTLVLNNSTVSDNRGGHGEGIYGIFSNSIITLNNSTISGNESYGVKNVDGTVVLKNTIIAENGSEGDCYNDTDGWDGTITSQGYSLIGDPSECTFTPTTGDLVHVDVKLGQLIGSPGYMPLLLGSPAIDAGNPAAPGGGGNPCLATDQRGVARPVGSRCDIGAYEYTVSGNAVSLSLVSGSRQRVAPGVALSEPLKVAALDSQGSPVEGVSITFTAPGSGASGIFADTGAVTTTVLTDINGIATTPMFTANLIRGAYTVTASLNGAEPVDFRLENFAWYVATTGNNNANSCLSPSSPCATIQAAVNKAANKDTILIARGRYTSTNFTVVHIERDVKLSGGWNAAFTAQTAFSRIDGENARQGVYVYMDPSMSASLDRFIIENGWYSDGGGISNRVGGVAVTVTNSTLRNNSAISHGGAILSNGDLFLINSTVSNNSAPHGGGISNYPFGHLVLNNSTVSNNSASNGGGIKNEGNLILNNTTVSDNAATVGGGIYNYVVFPGKVLPYNSIVAGNTAAFLGPDCYGSIESSGYNLIGNDSGCTFTVTTRDQVGTGVDPIDASLTPLQDNGGLTFTHALIADSPAIDAGDNANCPATDQRGIARPYGIACDIGAFEAAYTPVSVMIGNSNMGFYPVIPHGSQRQSFADINNGPVKITQLSNTPIMAAERVIYKVNGVNTSFSEIMALPDSQLDTTYWLPWYNNVNLDTQLRITNVTNQPASVTVTIGGIAQAPISLVASESTHISYAGVNAGPVKIVSDQQIVAAERVIYKVNGINTSFSEMMALPENQLYTSYWLPWYNNVNLDTQLRIANVTNNPATVTVTIGDVTQAPINLAAGESTRVSYAGVNAGPVKIVSDQQIVATERVIYKVNGISTSFSEMMALPENQLDTTYSLPWYNNKDLDTQLRFANTTNQTATVHVLIGGQEMSNSPFTLLPGESTRQSFVGINNGPVQIISDVPIVAAERVIYKVNGINTSFSETMALPNSQLDTIHWLPWYNNMDLDTQLRFGVP